MKVEHPIGLEPITRCLQSSRSTIELREQIAGISPALLYGLRPLYIIYYVSSNFVPNLSQDLQLGHTVSANGVSLDGLVHPAVQLRPADVQLVT